MMPRASAEERHNAGFTLQEVLVVVAIGLVITVIALPGMSNAIANMKLRSSMTTVSGLLQNARAIAVQQNKTKTACHCSPGSCVNVPNSLVYYVKDGMVCDTSITPAESDTQVELQAPITPYASPAGTGSPTALDNSTQLGVTSAPLTTDPSFNSRGIPCSYVSAGSCTTNNSFVQYYKDNRISGSGGWAAISISPAGRIKRWFWNGSTWVS